MYSCQGTLLPARTFVTSSVMEASLSSASLVSSSPSILTLPSIVFSKAWRPRFWRGSWNISTEPIPCCRLMELASRRQYFVTLRLT